MSFKNQPPAIRLLLVDDHTLFRESLRRLLESEPGLRISGDFANADSALAAIEAGLAFDAALIDYDLSSPGAAACADGLELVRRIRSLRPDARVLMVTAGMGTNELLRAVTELNAGIFLKTEPTVELMLAIQRTAQGERWISSRASLSLMSSQDVSERRTPDELSEREARVLRGVLEGQSNKEIGANLELTESSVKAVLQKPFERAGVRSRSQLVRYAIEAQIDPK